MSVARALADSNRARSLLALRGRELCVCQIIALLGLSPSTVSKHLSILEQAGLVERRKEGRWAYYHLRDREVSPQVRGALRWVMTSLDGDAEIAADARHLKDVLRIDPEKLCSRQRRS